LLAAAVVLVWIGVLQNGFVSYDDELYVTRNPHVLSGLTTSGIRWAFSTGYGGNWHPITWLSHMLDVELFGAEPRGHHATNLLLHFANTLLLYRLIRRISGARLRSAIAAVLFAVHPLRVESVAWISERKDLLCAFFGLLSILSYVEYVPDRNRRRYAMSIVLFALSLASKPMLVTLPFLLLLLDWWPLKRLNHSNARELVIEKLPYLALSAASSVVTYFVQRTAGATTALTVPIAVRLDNAVLSYVRYMGKLLWPVRLAPLYPYSGVTHGWMTAAAALLLLLITAACLRFGRRYPLLPVGWLSFIGTLVPVIGLVQVGWQSMADRYTYLPTIGLILIIVWGIGDLVPRSAPGRVMGASTSAAAFVALSVLTFRQIGTWRDSITLFQHAVSVTDRNDTMEINLGNALLREGRLEEARLHLERAVDICRTCPDARYELGVAHATAGTLDQAVAQFEEALRLKPDMAEAHERLGLVLFSQRRWDEAVRHLEQALRLRPDSSKTLYALGAALEGGGHFAEAVERYEAALHLDRNSAHAHSNLGLLLLNEGKAAEALPHLEATVRLDPGSSQAHSDLAQALSVLGRHEAASQVLREAQRLSPRSAAVLARLALEVAATADGDRARAEEAITHARTACVLTQWKDPRLLDGLARVQASAGRFDEARETTERAVALAQERKALDLVAELETRLASYRRKRAVPLTREQ
jgi:tetratricopeptide (TPR) repeat protein